MVKQEPVEEDHSRSRGGNGNAVHNAKNGPRKDEKQKTGKKQKSSAGAANSSMNE
ncbi:hypothetical protein LTR37_001986 [Vermiconidia calcicola]|uniref:Uncharacterized protein n=1 Tax=Vermiconidia calcicola TaxID=1690605 RepID=A0ACC3NUJ5_9PEZI|nr:hypothetical protein LTR37_001986 [Vermiconidia calcicola]